MKKASIIFALLLSSLTVWAITPLWLRDVAISPDGTQIAFCYKGDIWSVPSDGGKAVRLTTLGSYEAYPVWSPDGSSIAFASDRNGGFDVYIMPSFGGGARRLTYNSASEIPSAFTPDGKNVLFSASIQDPAQSALFPYAAMTELYSVPVKGGKTTQVLGTPAEYVSYSPDGRFFLYQDRKGGEDEWRKHHTSSVTRDIWRYDMATGKHTNLTNRPGEDRNPVLSADGKNAYILSEVDGGTMNVWSIPLAGKGAQMKQITNFDTHPVRFLSRGGDMLCFTWDGEIYTLKPGSMPEKVAIDLILDEENNTEMASRSSGATDASVSPDGKQIAFIVRGEVFVTSVEYNTTKQITHTAAAESNVDFGKDGRSLVYSSERDGVSQLYVAEIVREEDPDFPNATLVNEKRILPDLNVERNRPKYSPDGKELAFIEGRSRLMVLNMDSGLARMVTDGSAWYSRNPKGFDYEWSPDGKWFAIEFTAAVHEPYNDMGLVSASGGDITNLTASGYMSHSPRWVLDGDAILFESEIYGKRAHASWGSEDDVFLCFLNRAAFDKYNLSKEDYELRKELEKKNKDKKSKEDTVQTEKKINVELEGIRDRIVRLTPNSCNLGDAILSADGENLYYLASFEGGMDLWKKNLRERETKLIVKSAGGGRLAATKDGKTIFLLGGSLKKLDGDKLKPVNFKAEFKLDHDAEREYMFDYVYREAKERAFREDMFGVDWDAMSAAYRKFLPHISNGYDFAELLSEWLGELNVSHSGGRFYPAGSKEPTASLGLLFDWAYTGKGLKVSEIVKGGPFDHDGIDIVSGDVVTAIDGMDVTPEQDVSILLSGKAGRKTLVSIKGKKDAVVIPVSAAKMKSLLYDRWVRQRAADVEKWSGGRLGYVHIASMNDNSFRTLYSDVLGKYNKCDGIVIDTRFNGGGRMHEDIEVLFSGEKYLTQVIRGRESCDMPSRRWNKPSIMVQCEANYSNAHGTPWVYSNRHIGKLVGAPVPGTMSSVNWITMQDPDLVFGIPVIGYRTSEGTYLEGSQLEPDIYVLNSPETVVKGEDSQLRAAVKALLDEIDGK